MAYLILVIFVLSCLTAFVEDLLPKKYQYSLFCFFGLCLILMCGLKEVGLDPDSDNYAQTYRTYYDEKSSSEVESSFIIISAVLNLFTNDPHALFLFYALFGVGLKFFAFYRYDNKRLFLFLVLYLSYFYVVHEMMQIRTGILSAMYLLAIHEIVEGKRWLALIYILIGCLFHVSGLILLPILFFRNKPLSSWEKYIWTGIVVISLVISASGGTIFDYLVEIPYVGDKLTLYQKAADVGKSASTINGFGVFHLISIALFVYLVFFSDTINEKDRHYPILIKTYACGLMFYTVLGFVPDLAARVSFLYRTATIILLADVLFTIKPRWTAVVVTELIALFYFNYGLQFIHFPLLWKTAGAE